MTDDDSPIKEAMQDVFSDLYGSFDPRQYPKMLRRGIPIIGTLADLGELVIAYFTQEEYKTNNKKYGIQKGDLKAPKKLERMIPLYRQYKKHVPSETKTEKNPSLNNMDLNLNLNMNF